MHLSRHNFTGPGTKLNKPLNADLTPKHGQNLSTELIKNFIIMTFVMLKTQTQKLSTKFVIRKCWKNLMVFITQLFEKELIVESLGPLSEQRNALG